MVLRPHSIQVDWRVVGRPPPRPYRVQKNETQGCSVGMIVTLSGVTVMLALNSCTPEARSPSSAISTSPVRATPVALSSTVESPPVDPRCNAARLSNKSVIQKAHVGAAEASLLAQFDGCWSEPSGTWTLLLEQLCHVAPLDTDIGTVSWLGRWGLTYETAGKERATYAPQAFTGGGLPAGACIDTVEHPGNIAVSDLAQIRIVSPKVFDFDADGHAEFLLRSSSTTLRDHPEESGISLEEHRIDELVAYDHGKIQPYQPAANVVGSSRLMDIRDVDKDGRPDLFFTFNGFDDGTPPWRVAHSLSDGTFSASDPIAIAAERDQCPSAPSPTFPLLKSDGSVDLDGTQTAVACAMIRGEKPADVHQRLQKGCSKFKGKCASLVVWAKNVTTRGLK